MVYSVCPCVCVCVCVCVHAQLCVCMCVWRRGTVELWERSQKKVHKLWEIQQSAALVGNQSPPVASDLRRLTSGWVVWSPALKRQRQRESEGGREWRREGGRGTLRDGGSVKKRGEEEGWRSFPQQIPLSRRVERAPFLYSPHPHHLLLLLSSSPPLPLPLLLPPPLPLTNNAKTWQPTQQHMSNSFPSERGSHPTALAPATSEEWRAL